MRHKERQRKSVYTPKEVAALEGCNVYVVYRLLASSKLEGYRFGRSWRITALALERYRRRTSNQGWEDGP